MKLNLKFSNFQDSEENCHVIGVFQAGDKKPELACTHKEHADLLKALLADEVFKGGKGATNFFRATNGGRHLLFVGLGKPNQLTGEGLRTAAANAAKRLDAEKIKSAALSFDSFRHKDVKKSLSPEKAALCIGEGACLAIYTFDNYKSEKAKVSLAEISFYSREKKFKTAFTKILAQAEATNECVKIARDLSNEPGNVLHPMELAKRVQKYGKDYGISVKVLDRKELEKEKMGALIGVGQGSVNPPCLIVMDYKPSKKAKKTIAFVGKGVTFDSGGISLKPGQGMEDMKHDMSGAGDVIAATLLAAKLKSPNRVLGIIAAAENMPDGNAIVPSTILFARSGKTIEVQNTDAEGRLILSDALDYAQDFKPDAVIDVATLTGAVVVALGSVAAGMMGNDESLMKAFKAAAAETEEKFWELPLYQEYSDDMKSKIADIKNIGGEKGAGSPKGGAFLKEFIKSGTKWIHLDVAGTAWNQGFNAYCPKSGGTGHSVRTLARFAMDY